MVLCDSQMQNEEFSGEYLYGRIVVDQKYANNNGNYAAGTSLGGEFGASTLKAVGSSH